MSYKVAAPDEYLAITGMGIGRGLKICKSTWLFPFQRCMRFSVQPRDYAIDLQAMTSEKLQFLLPVIFTVGPDVNQRGANAKDFRPSEHDAEDENGDVDARTDKGDSLVKYAMLLAESSDKKAGHREHLEAIVKGIIEGETRVLVSSMTMEEIFNSREEFKKRVVKNIQSELDQFGLKIYNSNVKELRDAPGSVYFESLSRKAHEGATNQARIDVAEAQLKGNVGEAQRKGQQDREIAKIHAEVAVTKTERDIERAAAEARLHTQQANLSADVDIARIQAQRNIELTDEDLKKQVEIRRAAAEMERLRASEVVQATISREAKQQAADAHAYEVEVDAKANMEASQRKTDAAVYKTKAEAVAQADADFTRTTRNTDAAAYKTQKDSEAWSYAAIKNADANLQKKLREAEGVAAMADAYKKMADAFGGPAGLLQYMMIEKGTYVELAKANATAVAGMQPKISVWNTGSQGSGEGNSGIDTMRNVYQMLPPLMTTINDQTGITLPEWQFGRLAANVGAIEGGDGKLNGAKHH